MEYEPVIGLEVHAELQTKSKIFCGCRVVDSTTAEPNRFVCPVCAGMPGMLPVINKRAVEFGIVVALALNCEVAPITVFDRKNYFYPDLPKGYQITQYALPLAINGELKMNTSEGQRIIRIRRVHLEEDTGKLLHRHNSKNGQPGSLVDFNRSGVPLLEIVSEPDMRSTDEVETYAKKLRTILRYLGVNSGDMEKGVIRFEANVSIHKVGSGTLNTRTEIKNLNSFKSLVRSIEHEIERQRTIYASGGTVEQQTLGWNEGRSETVAQRSKEHAHDYRYFTEPDLPPLQITRDWVGEIRAALPELPDAKQARFIDLGLNDYEASVLASDRSVADYFERVIEAGSSSEPPLRAKAIANWISSQMFRLMNAASVDVEDLRVNPAHLAELIGMVESGRITARTGKLVLKEAFETGEAPITIVEVKGLAQVSDDEYITKVLQKVLSENPHQIAQYLAGKETVSKWLFGQVMQETRGKAEPQVLRRVLDAALAELKSGNGA